MSERGMTTTTAPEHRKCERCGKPSAWYVPRACTCPPRVPVEDDGRDDAVRNDDGYFDGKRGCG